MDGIIKQKEKSEKLDNKNQDLKPETELKTSLPLVQWEALEYEHAPKSNNWFWSVGVVAVGLIFAAILLNNILFAIFVTLAAFTIILYASRKPRKIIFTLTSRGLKIENRLFPYENLRSFWIHYDPPLKKILIIEPKKLLMPTISIPLADADPNIVREHLLKFLKEERREESAVQTLMRLFRF